MLNRLIHKLNHSLERNFPEQRVFLRSDEGTRFVIVSPLVQVTGWFVSAAFVAWQAGVDLSGEAWVTAGGAPYEALVRDGAIEPL